MRNELHGHFGLDESHMVYAGIALGWPDSQEPANKLYADRAPLSEVVDLRARAGVMSARSICRIEVTSIAPEPSRQRPPTLTCGRCQMGRCR